MVIYTYNSYCTEMLPKLDEKPERFGHLSKKINS